MLDQISFTEISVQSSEACQQASCEIDHLFD